VDLSCASPEYALTSTGRVGVDERREGLSTGTGRDAGLGELFGWRRAVVRYAVGSSADPYRWFVWCEGLVAGAGDALDVDSSRDHPCRSREDDDGRVPGNVADSISVPVEVARRYV
jgi:hypothetical protein